MANDIHRVLILEHMKKYGSINHYEAEELYGCTRLAARIKDLRNSGEAIETKMVKGKNRYDKDTHYAVYKLAEVENDVG